LYSKKPLSPNDNASAPASSSNKKLTGRGSRDIGVQDVEIRPQSTRRDIKTV
jgi:hypothetical protein